MWNRKNTEQKLLKECINGNAKAFEQIVFKYQSMVCSMTLSAAANLERSEELAHEVFIKVWQNLEQLDDLKKFQAWLCTVTRNVIRDSYRNNKDDILNKALDINDLEQTLAQESIDASGDPVVVMEKALKKLPERYREPLLLFYRQDNSIRQVAEQMQLSEDAIKQRLSRGRKMLKEEAFAIMEDAITNTVPGKAFTTAVIGVVTGLVVDAAQATAAQASSGTASTAISGAGQTILGTVATKIATMAVIVAVGVGGYFAYKAVAVNDRLSQDSEMVTKNLDIEVLAERNGLW